VSLFLSLFLHKQDLIFKGLGGTTIIGGVLFYVHVRREAEEDLGKIGDKFP
jgi:hypothetical protein